MAKLPGNILELIAAEKQLIDRPIWETQSDPRYFELLAPLAVPNVGGGAFQLRAKASKQRVNRDGMMQLEFAFSAKKPMPLWRCQWRPFETHQNENWSPKGYELARFPNQSHEHAFHDNWLTQEARLRTGNLPGAIPINPDPGSLGEFIAFSARRFRIINPELIELPQSTPDLFWNGP